MSLLVLGLIGFSSCRKVVGEGPLVTETRTVGKFTGVSFETSGKVNLTIGHDFRLELTAQKNILDVLQTNVASGVLHIDFKDNVRVKNYEEIIVNITAPTVDYLRLSGSGDMNVTGNNVANGLTMTLSGSGNIFVQSAAIADKIKASVSGL